jgi:hypothetical protein
LTISRHLRLIAVCAGLLASAGCSSERRLPTDPTAPGPAGPIDPAPPQPPSDPQRLAALALFEAVILHKGLTTSPLTYATEDGKVIWTNGPCVYRVNGQSAASASAAYRATDWSNLAATVSADSVRGQGLALLSELYDVTADGSAVWTRVGSNWSTTTYTPDTGSRLVNNSTSNVATFGGGSYSVIASPPQGSSARVEHRFDNLKVAINGTEYTLNGSLEFTYGFSGYPTHTGEIRIINNGTLVARIYGDVGNALTVEVLVPLVPL